MPSLKSLTSVVAVCWILVILFACWAPEDSFPDEGWSLDIPHLDKIVHATLFAGFGFLWMRVGPVDRRRAAWVLGLGLALAALTEAGQAFPVIGRTASAGDLAADALGLCLGVGAAFLLDRLARPAKALQTEATAT